MSQESRERFLLAMYAEMWSNINRHILVVWQPLGVVVGGAIVFQLAHNQVLSSDAATSVFLLLVAWLGAHAVDAHTWYNRNLRIIANIERQFLHASDLREIHCYFGEPSKQTSLEHVKLQGCLGAALGLFALAYHFCGQVLPWIRGKSGSFEAQWVLPYVVFVLAVGLVAYFHRQMQEKLKGFLGNSAGRDVRE